MRIAVVGSGVSGLVAALRLGTTHAVTLFEEEPRLGGHVHTVDVPDGDSALAIDTGFIVCNDWTYPGFLALLDELGVATQPSTMSFSVRCERTGLEYNGNTFNTLFAQRRNLFRPAFLRMLRGILRFNREGRAWLAQPVGDPLLGAWLAEHRFPRELAEFYVYPMGAAIWSAPTGKVADMPLRFFLRFFANHGMLSVDRRPTWRVVRGGSRVYVEALRARLRAEVRVSAPVESVRREANGVTVRVRGSEERFDHVVLATHGDQALALLADPTPLEREVLGAFRTQANAVVLHTDTSLLPRTRRAWAAWNYHLPATPTDTVAVTYDMNALQSLSTRTRWLVTLNRSAAIAPEKVVRSFVYRHPVYTKETLAAQSRWGEVSGRHRVSFCGAYWRNGFHEDGLQSALAVVEALQR